VDEIRDMIPAQARAFGGEGYLNFAYRATVEATEEAIVNALFKAETMTGRDGNTRYGLPYDQVESIFKKYGRTLSK
jgi:D-aminopeptidase